MKKWNFFDTLSIGNEALYAGVSLAQWIGLLDYRNELDRAELHPQTVHALQEAFSKHVKPSQYTRIKDDLTKHLNPLDLAILREHPAISILTVAAICTADSKESDCVWALTHMLSDTRCWKPTKQHGNQPWIRRAAACGLCHMGTAPALIALLDGAPYNSGVCEAAWALLKKNATMVEVAPALSRFIRRSNVFYKDPWHATNALAALGPAALPQIEELLKSHSEDVQDLGLEAVYTLGNLAAPLSPILEEMLDSGNESVKATILKLDLLERITGAR